MRITVCQLSDVASELEEQWSGLVAHCAGERPDLVVLPELGFSPWLAATDAVDQAAWDDSVAAHERWSARLPELGARVVVGSVPIVDEGRNHNAAFVWSAAHGLQHAHRKYHLPDEPGFHEACWYERGPKEFVPVETEVASIGFLLCTEMWFTEHARAYARAGVEVLASPRGVGLASLALTTDDEPFATRDVDLAVAHRAKSTYPRYVRD